VAILRSIAQGFVSKNSAVAVVTDLVPFDPVSYWEQRLQSNRGLLGVGYTSLGVRYNRWMYRTRRHVFFRTVKMLQLRLPEACVADIGSGTGFYLDLWKGLGVKRVDGVDLTEAAVSRLRIRFPDLRIYRGDIGDPELGGPLNTYDAVSAFDVLFHIVDDARYVTALRNINYLLRPGGLFLLTDLFLHSNALRSEHVVFRSLEDLKVLLLGSGFEILSRRPAFVFMNEPLDTRSRVHRFCWKAFERIVGYNELLGGLAGALIFPLELLGLTITRESCTTEVMVCRKVRTVGAGQWAE
jgi:SAM-dependent methyltransferase